MNTFYLNGDKNWEYSINNGTYHARKRGSNDSWVDLSKSLSAENYKKASDRLSKEHPITSTFTPSPATTLKDGTPIDPNYFVEGSGTTNGVSNGRTVGNLYRISDNKDLGSISNYVPKSPEFTPAQSSFSRADFRDWRNSLRGTYGHKISGDNILDAIGNNSGLIGQSLNTNISGLFGDDWFTNKKKKAAVTDWFNRTVNPGNVIHRGDLRDLRHMSELLGQVYTKGSAANKAFDNALKTELEKQQLEKQKTGGKMTQKYQAGGAAPQGDPQEQIIQLVQAAMQGDQQATAQIQQIMQAAQQGDPQAGQIAEMIMQVMNQMQGGAPQAARNGAKLNYIKRLKGECPEGYEMAYFKAGGKVCKKCQKVMKNCGGGKSKKACGGLKFHRAGGIMEDILTEIFAKGGAMNRNKHTAFGEERGANVVSTNHAGRWGGRRAFNANGTHQLNTHDKPNKFTAFGDEGKKKPTNVGLVGHKATGKTGRMQNRQKAGVTYKATAFGGEKQKRFHRGAKASSIGRIGSISGYPKGHGGKSGIGRI